MESDAVERPNAAPLFVPATLICGTPSRWTRKPCQRWVNSSSAPGTTPETGVGLSCPTCVPATIAARTPTSVSARAAPQPSMRKSASAKARRGMPRRFGTSGVKGLWYAGLFPVEVIEDRMVAQHQFGPIDQDFLGVGVIAGIAEIDVRDHDDLARHARLVDDLVGAARAGRQRDIVALP